MIGTGPLDADAGLPDLPGESVGGPTFVMNVLGPMPWAKIMPAGGVEPDEASLREWFGAGIVAAGMGSKLITNDC